MHLRPCIYPALLDTGRHLPCRNLNRLVGLSGLSRYKPSTDPPTKWDYCSTRRVRCCFSFFLAFRQGFASTSMASSKWYWAFENFILRHPSYSLILEIDTRVSLKYLTQHNIIIVKTFLTYRRKWCLNSISLIGNNLVNSTYFTLLF